MRGLLAKHIVRYIPGEPTIIVQNMVGAEGIKAANYIFTVAPQDGTAIGALSRNIGLVQLYETGNPAIQFDARKMHWIGSPQQEVGTGIFSTTKGLRSIDDLKTREVTASSTSRNAPTSVYPRMLNALYGTKIKVIEGYPGSPESLIAFERGEVEAYVSGGTSAPTLARMVAADRRRDRQGLRADGHEAHVALFRRPDRHGPRVVARPQADVRDRVHRPGHGPAVRGGARRAGGSRRRACARRSTPP